MTTVTLQCARLAGTQCNQYFVDENGFVTVDAPDVPMMTALGFEVVGSNQAVAALTPIPITSPPTYTLDDAVAKINEIVAALTSS